MQVLKIVLVYIFFFFTHFMTAQSWRHYHWDNAGTLDKSVFEQALEDFKTRNNSNIYLGDTYKENGEARVAGFYEDYKLGNIYPSFYGYEKYVKEVLKQVVVDTSLLKKIHVYFYYKTECNLTMDGLGNLRIYTGLFNYINTEAELAGALGHEFGHYFNNDLIERDNSEIQQESAADYVSIKLIKNSKYSTKGLADLFKNFKRLEVKAELVFGINSIVPTSHPDPGDRLKQVKILSKDSSNIGKKMFVVDSLKFFELKRVASQEAINLMVADGNFADAIEFAFRNYLYAPDDMENLALLTECLRRYIAQQPKIADKQFIIYNYKGNGAKKSENYKYVYDDETSILRYLNKGLLFLPSNDLSKVKAKDLLDSATVKFRTNKEAFDYFSAKAIEVKCKPCMISQALADPSKMLYNEELVKSNTVFNCNTFIESLRCNEQFSEDLFIVQTPDVTTKSRKREKDSLVSEYDKFLNSYMELIKTTYNLKNVVFLKDMSFDDAHNIRYVNGLALSLVEPNLYSRAIRANILSHGTNYINTVNNLSISKKEKRTWCNYSPELYNVFAKYKIKNIWFINFDIISGTASYGSPYGFPLIGSRVNKSRSWQLKKVSLDQNKMNVVYEHNITITKNSDEDCMKECITRLKWFFAANK